MKDLLKKKWFQGVLVGCGCAVFSLGLWATPLMRDGENITWRWRVRTLAEPSDTTGNIKVILIDQASLDWANDVMNLPWPWPREAYVPILDFCRRAGAKVIAFDMLYSEPSAYMVSDDVVFGDAIGKERDFIGAFFMGRQSGQTESWPEHIPDNPVFIDGLDAWLDKPGKQSLMEPRATFPIDAVAEHAAVLAGVKEDPESDGVFRRVAPFRVFDGKPVPSLGLASFLVDQVDRPYKLSITDRYLHIGEFKVPLDRNGKAILLFRGNTGTHESLSAAAIIQSELRLQDGGNPVIPPKDLKDKYVLLGVSAPGLKDLKSTPMQGDYPGVEIHATFLDNLIEQSFIRDANKGWVALVTLLLAIGAGTLVIRSSTAKGSVFWGMLFLAIPTATGFVLYGKGWWWPIMVQEVAVVLAIGIGELVNYATEGRQKRFIKSAFKQYLSGDVIEQIMTDPGALKLGGEKRELSIMFSDLQGFSGIAERLGPGDLTQLLNDYLSDMSDIIMEEGGTVDKYIGDAIMAFWNAPVEQEDHAVRACRAALRCQRKLAERRKEFFERTGAELYTRIGMHSGDVVVGNMGSHSRFNYTVMGDSVNLASRLEGANKQFGTFLMVTEDTWKKVSTEFYARETGTITVVGRKTPVRVFDIVATRDEEPPTKLDVWEQMLMNCRSGEWTRARELIDQCEDDVLCRKYREQLDRLISGEIESWDSIWRLTNK